MRAAVRSAALEEAALVVQVLADGLRTDAARVAGALSAVGQPVSWSGSGSLPDGRVWVGFARLEARVLVLAGPSGLWGQALVLDALALDLRAAARLYVEVEQGVQAVLAGVARGADLAARGGWLADGSAAPGVRAVDPTVDVRRVVSVADLVAAGDGLGGGRVRVLETAAPGGGSAWVVVVPGTQEWSPRAGPNPFDLTTDVRAVTGDATVAAAAVAGALELARARSARSRPDDPVMLVGHSQGGILAASLAADPGFAARHRVTHVVTSGSPVGVFPVPDRVRVLSVQHADDPVHRLDLTPNPSRPSWVTVQAPVAGTSPVDLRRHALDAHLATLHAAEGAPRGTVPGLDAYRASAGAFVGVPVRSVTDVVVTRGGG